MNGHEENDDHENDPEENQESPPSLATDSDSDQDYSDKDDEIPGLSSNNSMEVDDACEDSPEVPEVTTSRDNHPPLFVQRDNTSDNEDEPLPPLYYSDDEDDDNDNEDDDDEGEPPPLCASDDEDDDDEDSADDPTELPPPLFVYDDSESSDDEDDYLDFPPPLVGDNIFVEPLEAPGRLRQLLQGENHDMRLRLRLNNLLRNEHLVGGTFPYSDDEDECLEHFDRIEIVNKAKSKFMVTEVREWEVRNSVSHSQHSRTEANLRDCLKCSMNSQSKLVFYDESDIFEMDTKMIPKKEQPRRVGKGKGNEKGGDCEKLLLYEPDNPNESFVFFRSFETHTVYGFDRSHAYIHDKKSDHPKSRVIIAQRRQLFHDVVITRNGKYLYAVGYNLPFLCGIEVGDDVCGGISLFTREKNLVELENMFPLARFLSDGCSLAISKCENYLGVGTERSGYIVFRILQDFTTKAIHCGVSSSSSSDQINCTEFNCCQYTYESPLFLAVCGPLVKVYSLKKRRERCCAFGQNIGLAKWSPTLPTVFFAVSKSRHGGGLGLGGVFYSCKISEDFDDLKVFKLRQFDTETMGLCIMDYGSRIFLSVKSQSQSESFESDLDIDLFFGRRTNAKIIGYDLHHSLWKNSIAEFRTFLKRSISKEHFTDVVVIHTM